MLINYNQRNIGANIYNTRIYGERMKSVKVTQVGNSIGIVLSKEMAAKLRVDKGDFLYWSETSDGLELTPYDPDFAQQMDLAETILRENRDILKKLEK